MKTVEEHWSFREPKFPNNEWLVFTDRVEVWDGRLVAFRKATPQEVDNLFWSIKMWMSMVKEKI